MARVKHYRKKNDPQELDVTTFLNLMVVLIPFLLATAVFSKITIQELNLPVSSAGGPNVDKPPVIIEVMIRKDKVEIGDGKRIHTSIPKVKDKQDVAKLSDELYDLKRQNPDKLDATVLLEPDIEYQEMVSVMDAVKSRKQKAGNAETVVVLFPEVSIGDAP